MKLFWQIITACIFGLWTYTSANPLILLAGPSNTGGGSGGADATPPTLASRFINATTLVIDFSENVSQGSGYNDSDLSLSMSTGGSATLTYVSGNGTSTHTYTSSPAAVAGETVTLSFNGDLNSLEDAAGNDLAAVIGTAVTNSTPAALPNRSQFLAYWSLDDTGDPTTWVDQKGIYNLTKSGSTLSLAGGKLGGGADFNDATNDNLFRTSFNDTFHTSNFSVGGWLKMDDFPDDVILLSQYGGSTTSGTRHYAVIKDQTTNKFQFRMYNLAGTPFVAESDGAYATNGVWIHLVATRTGNLLTLYVNGAAQSTTATFSGSEQTATYPLRLANYLNTTNFDGKLDEVFVSTSAFTSGQILSLYNNGTGVAWASIPP